MNTAQIDVPQDVALQHFRNYREALKKKHDKEDEALMRGYKALAKGKRLLDLQESFRIAGVDEHKRPRLAIARCDWRTVFFVHLSSFGFSFAAKSWPHHNSHKISFPDSVFPETNKQRTLKSVVPAIPPQFRPAASLAGYHILWEPVWESVPSDPILLKHLQGSLYVVLAQWDLTPLEQAILRGRPV